MQAKHPFILNLDQAQPLQVYLKSHGWLDAGAMVGQGGRRLA
jgi:hypothetical protein